MAGELKREVTKLVEFASDPKVLERPDVQWAPGIRHGGIWSSHEKGLAIEAVISLMSQGHGVQKSCKLTGMSYACFNTWRQKDANLDEFVTMMMAIAPVRTREHGAFGGSSLALVTNDLKRKLVRHLETGDHKGAWLTHFRHIKDRILACKQTSTKEVAITPMDVIGWLEEDPEFAEAVAAVELEKKWLAEDMYWRQAVLYQNKSALRAIVSGDRKTATRKPEAVRQVHVHVGESEYAASLLKGMFVAESDSNGAGERASQNGRRLLEAGSGAEGHEPSRQDEAGALPS